MTDSVSTTDIKDRIEGAKRRLEASRREVIEHNTALRIAQDELARVVAEMVETYGVSSLEEAQAKLAAIDAKLIEKLAELEQW